MSDHFDSIFCFVTATNLRFRPSSPSSRKQLITRAASVMTLIALLVTPAWAGAQTVTQGLSAVISPLGGLFTITASTTLTKAGTVFTNYASAAPVNIQYRARTTQGTGAATITVKATTDFTCASKGPCIAVPPTAGDALKYTCSGATLGSNCPGTLTMSTTASTSVVTIPATACTGGGGSCSSVTPNTVNLNFTLTDDPKYKTGSYTATLTFTISAS
jgi:hypothetical protein